MSQAPEYTVVVPSSAISFTSVVVSDQTVLLAIDLCDRRRAETAVAS